MIREMKQGEEDEVRSLLAKLSFEDQALWRKQIKPVDEHLAEASEIAISEELEGRNVILVAEADDKIIGLCWCSIVDRGIDKQAEIAEFYVEREYRGKGVGRELLAAAKRLFVNEKVEVAFVWTHYGNTTAIKLYENAGFKRGDQLVMAFVPPAKDKNQARSG